MIKVTIKRLTLIINNKTNLLSVLLFITIISKAQNLVPNYNFNLHTVCCSSGGGGAIDWYTPLSNNIYNIQYSYSNVCCTNTCCGIPSNNNGASWQYPRTGNAYVSIFFSYNNGNNTRQYIQTKLLDSMKSNHLYYIEFYVNLFNDATYANNNISLLIGDTAIKYYNNIYTQATPQVINYGNPIIKDTLNWIKVSSIYIAHGGEQYITLGDFQDDSHTDTLQVNKVMGGYGSAYYIDDVSVMPLDSMQLKADAGRDTTITNGDSAFIGSYTNGIDTVRWLQNGVTIIDTVRPGFWVYPTNNTYYVLTQTVNGYTSSDTVYVTVKPLPVTLVSYIVIASAAPVIASAAKQSVLNQWQTSTEINTAYFNVQRSTDGVSFETIGKVKAKGASTYTFNDPLTIHDSRFTTLYYRLEVIDNDGKKTYSEVKELSIINYQLSIYPNPAKDFITVIGSNIKQVIISDISGRVLLKSTEKKIDVRSLVSGTYIVQIETISGNHVTEKLIKLP